MAKWTEAEGEDGWEGQELKKKEKVFGVMGKHCLQHNHKTC